MASFSFILVYICSIILKKIQKLFLELSFIIISTLNLAKYQLFSQYFFPPNDSDY